ncbi:MAG: queuosine precursor transporter [Chloroflexi bacterium]|nr:queuosine precursor transporter [Chloroflexota bacterium]
MNAQAVGRAYRYIDIVTAAFVAVLLISNIASTKIVAFGQLTFDGGTLLFPLAYIFGDILTEVYGYTRARRVIWIGFFWLAVMALTLSFVQALPPDPQWDAIEGVPNWTRDQSFALILGQTPRIVIASLLAYFAGEFVNSFVLAKMKVWTNGRYLWTRTIGSTLVGQAVDTGVFVVIAFLIALPVAVFAPETALPPDLVLTIFISNYVFKVAVEVLFTPLTYLVVNGLKRAEDEDYFDRNTNFNPFIFRV